MKLIIFGITDMARMAHFFFTKDSSYEIVAFTVSKEHMTHTKYLGLPVIPFEDILDFFSPDTHQLFIAIGYSHLNKIRAKYFNEAKKNGI